MIKGYLCSLLCLFFCSCSFFKPETEKKIIARVGDNYLYEEDIAPLIDQGLTKTDSAIIVNNFINTWAKKQLLVEKAKINLDEDRIVAFEKLVDDYKTDLYMAAYKEALVNREMDTIVSPEELTSFYTENKENFKLNEELLKLRYIRLDGDFGDIDSVKELLARFDENDKITLTDMSLQFKSYSLNDSTWVKAIDFMQKVPLINADNRNRYLKKSQFFELTDSLEVYLVHVKDILKRNESAPLAYITPTLQQIILNKRKLEFIRNLEKDLIDEAIQKKRFEVYEKN